MDIAIIIQKIAINALPLLFSIILHEISHGYVADKLGDPTARMLGRLTLNPLPHIDPIGTVLIPLMLLATGSPVLFGYAKPVPITTSNFKNPRRDMAISAAAGPITNLLLALISVILLRLVQYSALGMQPDSAIMAVLVPIGLMLNTAILWNVYLAIFNLIPLLPLDGGRVLMGFLPPKQAYSFSRIEPYGFFILIALIFTGLTRYIVGCPANLMFGVLEWIGRLI